MPVAKPAPSLPMSNIEIILIDREIEIYTYLLIKPNVLIFLVLIHKLFIRCIDCLYALMPFLSVSWTRAVLENLFRDYHWIRVIQNTEKMLTGTENKKLRDFRSTPRIEGAVLFCTLSIAEQDLVFPLIISLCYVLVVVVAASIIFCTYCSLW